MNESRWLSEVIFTIIYKHELSDLENIQLLEFGYEAGSAKSSMGTQYDGGGPKSKTFSFDSGSGLVSREEDVISAFINIDGKTEIFELKKQ